MIENFYTNCANKSTHLLRDPIGDVDLSAKTVAWVLKPTAGGDNIASGNAEYMSQVVSAGKTYYKFLVVVSKEQAAGMTDGTEYTLELDESTTGAGADPKALATVYRGRT